MIKTAQDAYLAGRQAAMEKLSGLPISAIRGSKALKYTAGGLGAGALGYGLYRGVDSGYLNGRDVAHLLTGRNNLSRISEKIDKKDD